MASHPKGVYCAKGVCDSTPFGWGKNPSLYNLKCCTDHRVKYLNRAHTTITQNAPQTDRQIEMDLGSTDSSVQFSSHISQKTRHKPATDSVVHTLRRSLASAGKAHTTTPQSHMQTT